jgi:hypothetical protein
LLVFQPASVAVQLMAERPLVETENDPLAVEDVPTPLVEASVTPVQVMVEITLPPFVESSAVTVPVTGPVTNHPLLPFGVPPFGPVMVSANVGAAVSDE